MDRVSHKRQHDGATPARAASRGLVALGLPQHAESAVRRLEHAGVRAERSRRGQRRNVVVPNHHRLLFAADQHLTQAHAQVLAAGGTVGIRHHHGTAGARTNANDASVVRSFGQLSMSMYTRVGGRKARRNPQPTTKLKYLVLRERVCVCVGCAMHVRTYPFDKASTAPWQSGSGTDESNAVMPHVTPPSVEVETPRQLQSHGTAGPG